MKTGFIKLSLIRKPSAYLPLGMSLAALVLVLAHAAVFGITHDPDEGAAAHTWQILMAAQLPFVAYVVIRWLPSQFKETLEILAVLAATWLANFAAVYFLT